MRDGNGERGLRIRQRQILRSVEEEEMERAREWETETGAETGAETAR